ncbi:MAG: hypothetical protein A3F70_02265 [Acidobacteria bacterium RIFCSPLOWO2_12_FULL_67_14]|nr:MAG: hypothetical protein A3H29_17550 [Acidobacteria bacterium RIFCSPLOWO2_02_FULL_67_21]OFW37755.1 MAG: hypothetical protein A3F70_02265 [Acidobacteria bacterium RIFCSPLOWO2_12_FULL_67_14]
MTYYGPKELAASYRQVRGNTLQIADDIAEAKYDFRAAPDCRTVAQTLVHIAFGPAVQLHMQRNRVTDLQTVNFLELIQPLAAEEARPRSKAEIVALLRAKGDEFASYLESLPEPFLAEPVTMPPGSQPVTKSRFEMLLSPKEHEMHHRAQLMVAQRMMGLTPHLTRQMQERMAQRAAAAGR